MGEGRLVIHYHEEKSGCGQASGQGLSCPLWLAVEVGMVFTRTRTNKKLFKVRLSRVLVASEPRGESLGGNRLQAKRRD